MEGPLEEEEEQHLINVTECEEAGADMRGWLGEDRDVPI